MEEDLINELKKQGRIILSIGVKGSGKSFGALNFLKYAYANNMYDKYFIVVPKATFTNGEYKFIMNEKNTTIFNGFNESVPKAVLKHCDGRRRIFFMIEDSSQYSKQIHNNQDIANILTTSRWLNMCFYMITHGAKIMNPMMRANADYVLLSKITSEKLLMTIYEEFFSLLYFKNFKEFKEHFLSILRTPYNGLLIDNITNKYGELKDIKILQTRKEPKVEQEVKKKVEQQTEPKVKKGFCLSRIRFY